MIELCFPSHTLSSPQWRLIGESRGCEGGSEGLRGPVVCAREVRFVEFFYSISYVMRDSCQCGAASVKIAICNSLGSGCDAGEILIMIHERERERVLERENCFFFFFNKNLISLLPLHCINY